MGKRFLTESGLGLVPSPVLVGGLAGRPPLCVEVYDPAARTAWAQRLQVSEQQLLEAVRFVGVELESVRLYLGQRTASDR